MCWSRVRSSTLGVARIIPVSVLVALALAAIVTMSLFALTFAALPSDRSVFFDRAKVAFRDGVLPDAQVDHYDVYQSHIGNECISLSSVVTPPASRIEESLSVRVTTPSVPPCVSFRRYVVEHDHDVQIEPYDRYLHGWRLLWLTTLPYLSVSQVFQLTFTLGLAALFGFVGISAFRTFHAFSNSSASNELNDERVDPHIMRIQSASFLIIGLSFVIFFGWFSFGFRPTHAVWGILVFLFLIAAAIFRFDQWSSARLAGFCACFGALLATVDFLVGAAPLGLAVVIAMIALKETHLETEAYVTRISCGAVAFICGFVFPFIIKISLLALLTDSSAITEFVDQLLFRMAGNGSEPAAGLPQDLVDRAADAGFDIQNDNLFGSKMLAFMAAKLVYGMSYTVSSVPVGALMLGTAFAAGCLGLVQTFWFSADPRVRRLAAALVISLIVIVVWFLIFRQHTIIHTRFMSRLMVWPVAVGYVLGLIGVLNWLSNRQRRND